jgi:hypothetical protein
LLSFSWNRFPESSRCPRRGNIVGLEPGSEAPSNSLGSV